MLTVDLMAIPLNFNCPLMCLSSCMGSSGIGNVFCSLLYLWFQGVRGMCVLPPNILPWKAAMPCVVTTLVRLTTSLWRCSRRMPLHA
jgi:hypothetical protein